MIDGELTPLGQNLQAQADEADQKAKVENLNRLITELEKDQGDQLSEDDNRKIVEFGGTIDFGNVKPNSALIIKVSTKDPIYAANFQMGVIKQVLEPRMALLREKKLTVLFMAAEDDLSLLTEEDMAKAGWVKKDKSLIINPFDK